MRRVSKRTYMSVAPSSPSRIPCRVTTAESSNSICVGGEAVAAPVTCAKAARCGDMWGLQISSVRESPSCDVGGRSIGSLPRRCNTNPNERRI